MITQEVKMPRTVRFELLRPDEIVAERERCPVIYLPIGPLEWHAPHLPFGTDALNAEAAARSVAEQVGGVVLPTLFCGTERERNPKMCQDLGFPADSYIVGMDFPANAIPSLYYREEFFALLVRETLDRVIRLGYKLVVIVNGHGAANHMETLRRLSKEFSALSPARVLFTVAFPVNARFAHSIGHADVGEASVMMALQPESVDLGQLPPLDRPLRNVDYAIVDSETFDGSPTPDYTVREGADPRRHASAAWGREIMEQTAQEISEIVRAALTQL
jgi:creatinine amidohydrolase